MVYVSKRVYKSCRKLIRDVIWEELSSDIGEIELIKKRLVKRVLGIVDWLLNNGIVEKVEKEKKFELV